MSKSKRIENFLKGILIIVTGLFLTISPDNGYKAADLAFAVVFTAVGIRYLVYYFMLARYMAGGLMALFYGVVFTELGLFAASIVNMAKNQVMLFLMIGFIVAGVCDVSEAVRLKRISSPVWGISLVRGIACILFPLAGIIFFGSSDTAAYVYSCIIIFRGLITLLSAFRRTAVVYVNE